MPRETKEDKIAKNMRCLGITYEEAKQIVEDEEIIDKGGKCDWETELTPEQKKVIKEALKADRKPTTKKATTNRTKVENKDKQKLIESVSGALGDLGDITDIDIINNEREFTFNYKGTKYKIVLSAPRS